MAQVARRLRADGGAASPPCLRGLWLPVSSSRRYLVLGAQVQAQGKVSLFLNCTSFQLHRAKSAEGDEVLL